MYLVLCSSSDVSALWAYQTLKQMGVAPLELVLSESLAHGTRWEHRLDRAGAHLKLLLADGRVICGSRIRGVLNRLTCPPPVIARQAADSDREYAQAELQAFYLSWINALAGVVINAPSPMGLCGAWYHASEWAQRAGHAGLPVHAFRQSAHDAPGQFYQTPLAEGAVAHSFIAFGGKVFGGELPSSVADACTRLATEANARLLGITLHLDANNRWTFAGASPSPDLTLGGLPLLRQIATELTQGVRL